MKHISQNYFVRTLRFFLRLASCGSAMTHFRNPVNKTELITKIAPPIENLFGISLKNKTCHIKANTISLLLAIATGPACSICKAKVSSIWPKKLNRAKAIIRYLSMPQEGKHKAPIKTVTKKHCTRANAPKFVIMTEKCIPFRALSST
ncbi:hypothetical protein JTB14_018918 [Gonioctena quinquepunctata]|nr:hypothetical protein JTB14_018918 [Gonioctena quinquepunctata]